MKLKTLFLSMAACSIFLSVISCGGSAEKTIKDERLHPFVLGGIYTVYGYGGGPSFFNMVKEQMTAEPGSGGFLKELDKVYNEAIIYPFGLDNKAEFQRELKNWWGVEDKASFLETQNDLITKGHQAAYESCRKAIDENGGANADVNAIDLAKYSIDEEDGLIDLQFVKDNYSKFSKAGIKAWDIARYINNINMAHAAGYLTDDEGFEMSKKATAEAQKYYENWADYFKDFNLGRGFWGGDNSVEFDQLVTQLLDSTNVYSIYSYMPIK